MRKIHSAASYYSSGKYPLALELFPQFAGDLEGVKQALRRIHPGCDDIKVTERKEVKGFCKAGTMYHTLDWAIVIIYE